MRTNDFIALRLKEKKLLFLNGYGNADPKSNGEFAVLKKLINSFQLLIDVGAHLGDHSQEALKMKKDLDVLIFEPNKNLRISLKKKFAKYPKVKIYSLALADKKSRRKLYIHPTYQGSASMYKRVEMMPSFYQKMKPLNIEVATLNSFYKEIVSRVGRKGCFVKIDTEGAELLVLTGGQRILKLKVPIFIMFEYLPRGWRESKQSLKKAFHLLDSSGFIIFRVLPLGLELVKYYSYNLENFDYCNYLAIKNFDLTRVFRSKRKIAARDTFTVFYPFKGR